MPHEIPPGAAEALVQLQTAKANEQAAILGLLGHLAGRPSEAARAPSPPAAIEDDPQRLYVNGVQAARVIGVSISTLQRMVRRGEVPAYQLSRGLRFDVADLDALICRRRRPPLPPASQAAAAPVRALNPGRGS